MQTDAVTHNTDAVSGIAVSAALVVAFAIQQTVEIFDSISAVFLDTDKNPEQAGKKKAILKLCSLALGILAVAVLKVDVLSVVTAVPSEWHGVITAIALAGGTEGVNSVVKYLGYAKESKKNDAAAKLDPSKKDELKAIGRK
jgi:hypothetical protein